MHSCVNRQLVGSCCLVQALSAELCDDLEGCVGQGGGLVRAGLYVCLELILVVLQQRLTRHGDTVILQLKKLKIGVGTEEGGDRNTKQLCGKVILCD